MSDEPKSALELAMERLRQKDIEQGVADTVVSDDQKTAIASIRQTYAAKLAQEEILFKPRLGGLVDPEARQQAQAGHRREMQRLADERDRKIDKIRNA